MHEKLELVGKVGKLQNPIVHYNYQTVSQYIKKLDNTYTESEAQNFIQSGKDVQWYDAIRWPISDFVKTYFFQEGYKDGLHGLVLSQLQAFYSLVFFAKVWERKEKFKDLTPPDFLNESSKELAKAFKEIWYWVYTAKMETNIAKKLYYKIRRRLR